MAGQVLLFEQEAPIQEIKQVVLPEVPKVPKALKHPKKSKKEPELPEIGVSLESKCFHNLGGQCLFVAGCGPCTFCWNWCIVDKREIKDLFEYLGKKEVDKIFGEDQDITITTLRDDY